MLMDRVSEVIKDLISLFKSKLIVQLSGQHLVKSDDLTGHLDHEQQFLLVLNMHVAKHTDNAKG